MASIIKRMLKQKAAYWAPVPDQFDIMGQPLLAAPVVVKCRWEDKSEEFISLTGTRDVSNAKVYSDTDTHVNGFLYLLNAGIPVAKTVTDAQLLATIPDATDPMLSGGWKIRKFEKTPNLRAKEFIRLAIM